MSKQLPLDLSIKPDFSAPAFLQGAGTAEGWAALKNTAGWANHALALIGPKGCGKTHLGHIWAVENEAVRLNGHDEFSPKAEWKGRALWIDNAAGADEFTLFTLINLAIASDLKGLLLTDRTQPSDWQVQIPDLHSRLKNLQTARLEEPDDKLLTAIVEKMFKDKGLKVSGTLTSFLLANTERSVDALRSLITNLDRAAASEKANVTRNFAAKYLQGKLF